MEEFEPLTFSPEEIEASRQETLCRLFEEPIQSGVLDEDHISPEEFEPGTFGYHEAVHTTYVTMNLIDNEILDHPAIALNAEAYQLAHAAHTAIFNLYQHLGLRAIEAVTGQTISHSPSSQ